jgi:hypothetical protein
LTDWKALADDLLAEFDLVINAKPKSNAVDIQLEKDVVSKWAYHLATQRGWGTDQEIAEACHQLEWRLTALKLKLITELLKHGPV